MPPNRHKQVCHPHVQFIMDETGESDPAQAVRMKARAVVEQYHALLGEAPPFNMQALASVRGLRWSDDDPRYSADSEIAPEADGCHNRSWTPSFARIPWKKIGEIY